MEARTSSKRRGNNPEGNMNRAFITSFSPPTAQHRFTMWLTHRVAISYLDNNEPVAEDLAYLLARSPPERRYAPNAFPNNIYVNLIQLIFRQIRYSPSYRRSLSLWGVLITGWLEQMTLRIVTGHFGRDERARLRFKDDNDDYRMFGIIDFWNRIRLFELLYKLAEFCLITRRSIIMKTFEIKGMIIDAIACPEHTQLNMNRPNPSFYPNNDTVICISGDEFIKLKSSSLLERLKLTQSR